MTPKKTTTVEGATTEPRGPNTPFPFSAVVGQDDLRLALLLTAVDPKIGGVLVRGDKGSAKTTTARGLASLLPGGARFVELPIGATEDRVVGSIDLRAALVDGERRFSPGLLADAHGGVLYVDEVNLLPDHLVDVLLDVAQSATNRVERDGVSHTHPSRFVLIGSMNPEEGELRPQLLDRFGLAVQVVAPTDPKARAEAVRRRLELEADPASFFGRWDREEELLRDRLARARPARLAEGLVESITEICAGAGAEGLRADLVCCRAAAALAGWLGEEEAGHDHVRRVAPLALAHRSRRGPFDAPSFDNQELEALMDELLGPADPEDGGRGGEPSSSIPQPKGRLEGESTRDHQDQREGEGPREDPSPVDASPHRKAPLLGGGRGVVGPSLSERSQPRAPGRRTPVMSETGRLVGAMQPSGSLRTVAIMPTIDASASRRGGETERSGPSQSGSSPLLVESDLREAVHASRAATLVVLVVDASGSMGVDDRIAAAKGAVVSLLVDAYERRDRVALVTFREDSAQVVLRPTGSVEVARARLENLRTGGRTPLAAGIESALELALGAARGDHLPLIVLVSDGRATSAPDGADPLDAAIRAADKVRRMRVPAVVVDAEDGPLRLGFAGEIARAMGARLVTASELTADGLVMSVRDSLSDLPSMLGT